MDSNQFLLSICINTRNRSDLLIETVESLRLFQSRDIEIVIMDGASLIDHKIKTEAYIKGKSSITYVYSEKDIGIDEGYDLCVDYAQGKYCWLLPDDDLIFEDKVSELLSLLSKGYDLILANLECWTKELSHSLRQPLFQVNKNTEFSGTHSVEFWKTCGVPLSYIGSIIVKKEIWLEIDKAEFYGSYFAHVQVIMNSTQINSIILIADPIIKYRSGNSSWTSRSFEIWNFIWPNFIWTNPNLSQEEKLAIVPRQPWRRVLSMVKSRAMGEYNLQIYKHFLKDKLTFAERMIYKPVSLIPATLLNYAILSSLLLIKRDRKYSIYNLAITNPHYRWLKSLLSKVGIYV